MQGGGFLNRNSENLKADKNTLYLINKFINSDAKYMLIMDSDLLIHSGFFDVLNEQIEKTDGVLSLYNSFVHKGQEYNESLCLKRDAGFAGLVIRKDIAEMYLDMCSNSENLVQNISFSDWGLSEFLRLKNIRLFCLNKSQIQHLGFVGQNNSFKNGLDFAVNFEVQGKEGQYINDVIFALSHTKYENNTEENSKFCALVERFYGLIKFLGKASLKKNERHFYRRMLGSYKFLKINHSEDINKTDSQSMSV